MLRALGPGDVVSMLDRVGDGILVVGADWRTRYLNEPAARMLGRPRAELLGRDIRELFPEAVGRPVQLVYERAARERRPATVVDHSAPLGRWFEHRVQPEDGDLVVVLRDVTDVTDREHAERALGASERRIGALLEHSPSVIAVKDLDGRYVMANAELGRLLGRPAAELIGRECTELFEPDVAQRLRAGDRRAAAEGEPVYDEVVLLRDGEPRTFVTVTFALPDADGSPAETCTIGTDVTEAREREGARAERLAWRSRIAAALQDGRMVAFAQPIVDLCTGDAAGAELLVRMLAADDTGTVLEPGAFLPEAERFGMVQEIDLWMVRQALALALELPVAINLSAVTLGDLAAMRAIEDALAADPDAARRIVFEITETAAVEHLAGAEAFAARIASLGARIALDDFGTGFGSFTYLRELPLDHLKIDRGFVAGLERSEDDRRVVRSVIGIAREFGLRTIAEGVEDEATLRTLRGLGAGYAQGFHLGRPAPVTGSPRAARAGRTR